MEELIGQGRTADVFRYDDNKVVKIFHAGFTQLAYEEFEKAIKINNIGISVPHAYELIDISSDKGIVYELVQGMSMIQLMQMQPLKVTKYANQLANLHAEIHSKSVNGLGKVKESLISAVHKVQSLKPTEKESITKYINTLPDGDYLCHYDFHPGNILISNDTLKVIDWMTAEVGNPCADVCRTGLILNSSILPPGVSAIEKIMIKTFRKTLYKKYIAHYCKITGVTPDEVDRWLLPVAAARLAEEIEEETAYLSDIISKRLYFL